MTGTARVGITGGRDGDGEVAIVTGSAGGIGEAAARAIAGRGVRVAVADVRADAAEETARRLQVAGLAATAVTVDIGDPASVEAMVERVLGLWGRIDILVNNAGIESAQPFLEIDLEHYERVMRINATGVWLCCQAVRQEVSATSCRKLRTLPRRGRRRAGPRTPRGSSRPERAGPPIPPRP